VYDVVNVVPFVMKHKRHPVTGQPLALKDLVKLNFHKNGGACICVHVVWTCLVSECFVGMCFERDLRCVRVWFVYLCACMLVCVRALQSALCLLNLVRANRKCVTACTSCI